MVGLSSYFTKIKHEFHKSRAIQHLESARKSKNPESVEMMRNFAKTKYPRKLYLQI